MKPKEFSCRKAKIKRSWLKYSQLTASTVLILESVAFIDDFIDTRYVLVREKDMPGLLRRAGGIAFMGSDNVAEIPDDERAGLSYQPVALNGARFALQVRSDRLEEFTEDTLLRVATSYPSVARNALPRTGRPFVIDLVVGGSVEAMPYIDPSINAVVDVVNKGDTMRANNLAILEDNLECVQIGAVWRQ